MTQESSVNWFRFVSCILPPSKIGKVRISKARRERETDLRRRWALPAPIAATHAALNIREKRTGSSPNDRPSSLHWEEHMLP